MPTPIRIALIEPNEVLLEGFYRTFNACRGIRVVSRATGAERVLATVARDNVQVIVSNIESQDLDAVEVATILRRKAPEAKLVVYGPIHPGPLVKPLLRMGVCTYFIKDRLEPSELREMVTEVFHHNFYYTEVVTREVVLSTWSISDECAVPDFTEREEELLRLVCQGNNRKQVAEKMFLSEATVKYHLQHIFEKSGVTTTQELLLAAFNFGWLSALELRGRYSASLRIER